MAIRNNDNTPSIAAMVFCGPAQLFVCFVLGLSVRGCSQTEKCPFYRHRRLPLSVTQGQGKPKQTQVVHPTWGECWDSVIDMFML